MLVAFVIDLQMKLEGLADGSDVSAMHVRGADEEEESYDEQQFEGER